jgi:hypothetical protein
MARFIGLSVVRIPTLERGNEYGAVSSFIVPTLMRGNAYMSL